MKKIFFTALSGLPFEDSGGPNKVINQIITKIDKTKYDVFYLSKNTFSQFKSNNFNNLSPIELKTKLTQRLFSQSKLYRKIFTSSFYLNKFYNNSIKVISEKLASENWDILHAHDVRTLFNLIERKGKVILTIHSKGSVVNDMTQLYGKRKSLNKIYQLFSELELKSLEIADVITFPSLSAKELFFEDKNIFDYTNKSKVVYNGINLDKINNKIADEKFLTKWNWLNKYDYRILTVGSHIEVKNIDLILKVFSLVNKIKPNKSFLISVGSGNKTEELKNLAQELKIANNIKFIDYLPNSDVISLMKLCNIYLSLSIRVIFDLVILEALACGMNVIASNDGGNREVIQNNNGTLVNLDDFELIANKILSSDLGINKNAIQSVQKFSIDNMVREYLKIYEE